MHSVGALMATLKINTAPFLKDFSSALSQAKQQAQSLTNAVSSIGTKSGNNASSSMKQVSASLAQVSSSAKSASKNVSSAMKGASDSAKDASDKTGGFKDSLSSLGTVAGGITIAGIFSGVANEISSAGKALTEFTSNMQKAQISYEYLLGSSEKAKGYIALMNDFAATTSFDTEQAIDMSRMLMAGGFQVEKVKDLMEIVNDFGSISRFKGNQLERLVYAMTQIKSTGVLLGGEVRQISQANVPILDILKEELGLTSEQIKKIGDLKIPAEEAITAIARGMQKRAQGAAKKISNTIGGMLETIHDDSRSLGAELFKGPIGVFEDFIRIIRDKLEAIRDVFTKQGIGGVFESFIPKELQQSLKNIYAGFMTLIDAIKPLAKLVGESLAGAFGVFIQVLGAVLPPISAVALGISKVIQYCVSAAPWVKILVGAIGGLVIANLAANALSFLWTVTRAGAICTLVAEAVNILRTSIIALTAAVTRTPLGFGLTLLTGSLIWLASATGLTDKALESLMNTFNKFLGYDTENMLNPEETDTKKWMDEFSKSATESQKNLKDVGKEAKEAGKKVKDSFVASFDEVFQVPDKLKEASNELANMGGKAEEKKKDDAKPKDNQKQPPSQPQNPTVAMPPFSGGGGIGNWIGIAIGELEGAFAKMGAMALDFAKQFSDALSSIGESLQNVFQPVTDMVNNLQNVLDGSLNRLLEWSGNVGDIVGNFTSGMSASLLEWSGSITDFLNNLSTSLVEWSGSFASSVSDVLTGLTNSIIEWSGSFSQGFDGAFSGVTARFIEWSGSLGSGMSAFFERLKNAVKEYSVETISAFASVAVGSLSALQPLFQQAPALFKTAFSAMTTSVTSWATNLATNISSVVGVGAQAIAVFSQTSMSNIGAFVSATAGAIATWGINVGANVASVANGVSSATASFAQNGANNISSFVSTTSAGIASWASSVLENMKAFANGGMSAAAAFGKGAWSGIANFVKSTASGIASWATSTFSTISSWASRVVSIVQSVGRAIGASFGEGAAEIGGAVSTAGASISEYASENKNWLIPVGVAAGVVGIGALTVATGGAALPAIAGLGLAAGIGAGKIKPVQGLANGGIVSEEQLIAISEGNRKEAVVPLENSGAMSPFSRAVANDLASMQGGAQQAPQDTKPVLYVHNLIANEEGLRQLYREFTVIQEEEDRRGGLGGTFFG